MVRFFGDSGADFGEAEFSGDNGANFKGAVFSGAGGANFFGAKFSGDGGADFGKAKFSGKGIVDFGHIHVHENSWMEFSLVQVESPRKLRFENVGLGRTSFFHIDIEEFRFKNVQFGNKRNRFINRGRLADEIWKEFTSKRKRTYNENYFSHVEILYRQLKRNFEEMRNYSRAGDFHYG